MDRELERFKREIDLREYAASLGYELDKRESSRGNAVMRKDADKLIIKRDANGHYVYFSLPDYSDNGTIIDFAQRRTGLTLGALRKELRRFSGTEMPAVFKRAMAITAPDPAAVLNEFNGTSLTPIPPYLVRERFIPETVISSPRFKGCIRIDARMNAVFPHTDDRGVCGMEKKNLNFTGFSLGGEKGLWLSNQFADDAGLVFCESAIECLSYATLFPGQYRYASIAGRMNTMQEALSARQIEQMPRGVVIAAMNADNAGIVLALQIAEIVCVRRDLSFRAHMPEIQGTDWNDVLKMRSLEGRVPGLE